MEAFVPFFSAVTGALVTLLVALFTIRSQREKMNAELYSQTLKHEDELRAQRERLGLEFKTELSVERALQRLLSFKNYRFRSFTLIGHYIGGFERNELRKLLVRAGAARFIGVDGTEFWALTERVSKEFERGDWKLNNEPKAGVPDSEFFPFAFTDKTQL
jgi:hypothetical protein